ncbi:MAG: tfuA protein, partial [Hyphomicrobiales bacterium]|nr:tfuA protein [Hyphomicrobiales bacterium]
MTFIVFVGPTLDPKEVADAGDFTCLPPVSQGDVYRAARNRPRAIGIIDGYFSGAPSVWHKEILWAIS